MGALMGSLHLPKMTATLLQSYSQAALRNADDLLVEAKLLRDHEHMARAYFLAVACIEEAGKALLAYDGQNRNLSDPAVCLKLKRSMEDHGNKIAYAMGVWAISSPDQSEGMKAAIDIISQVQRGREPSMYSDLRTDPDRVQTPRDVVRPKAGRDCVLLAGYCLAHAHRHISEKEPAKFTSAQEKIYTMKAAKFQAILTTEDFLLYFLSRAEAGQQDIAEAVLQYQRDHIDTGTLFRPAP